MVPIIQRVSDIGSSFCEISNGRVADDDHMFKKVKRDLVGSRFKFRKKIPFSKRNYRAERGSAFARRCCQRSQARYTAARNDDSSALNWPARP